MEDIFGPLLLLTFCLIISYWENNKFGTYITPFGALAWPYTIVVIMINLVGKHFGFFPVSIQSNIFVISCLGFFLIGGQGILLLFESKKIETAQFCSPIINTKELFNLYRPLFYTFAFISIIAGVFHFLNVIGDVGWKNIGSPEFTDVYGKGALAHIMLLSRPAFIFIFTDFILRNKKASLIVLFIIFIMVIVRQVKYHVVILFLSGIYFSYIHNIFKFSLKKAILFIILIYFLFNLSYVIGFSVLGINHAYSSDVQAFLFNHFFTYLFGGPIGFSEIFKDNSFPLYSYKEIFSVPINLSRIFQGDQALVDIIINKWIPVSNIRTYFHSSNTFGIFGMSYVYLGILGTYIYLFIIGLVAYTFLLLVNRYKTVIGYQLVYVLIMGFLTLSFFGLYFNTLTFLEVSVYSLLIPQFYLYGREINMISLLHLKIKASK